MYFLISPAKNLNEKAETLPAQYTQPEMLEQSEILMQDVRPLAPQDIAKLMHVSDKIALLNVERNQVWQPPFTPENAKQALYLFNGDVYDGIDARSLKPEQIQYLQQNLRMLSGLYGLLKPLDLMQPYRLEMGTALANSRGKNLYEFWGNRITERINTELHEKQENTIVNLASQEYFKAVQPEKLNARIITPVFKDEKNGVYKIISFYAKRARGLMVRHAAQNGVTDAEQLKQFNLDGYQFNAAASSENEWVFLR
ncbi:peroxide stress protein YaaA [Kingella negevensis]|uniref:peroxide stress protein YaaA n=1 Tax=Kingella negevensis TaxID=1522312 RepID=UPI00050A3030|nr:peroxide stress protein YaaA [Kingella negevensis]MDK4688827.1 peroxide stress protein YaaA [Kingella negevensis]WII90051.1 peroxide stress protein YaaA [Kingella negevensis]WII94238.1 peroxide stress protein YaaA [Kingella negevensis]